MSTQTIYARVPDSVKDATDVYASEHGMTLTGAVVDLLGRGLVAVSDESSVRDLQRQVEELRQANASLTRDLDTARATLVAVNERTRQPLALCPTCKTTPITGHDLLVTGCCPNPECGVSLTGLLPGGSQSDALDNRELLVLLAAIGVALGVAWVATKS